MGIIHYISFFFSRQPHKMVRHTQKIRRQQSTNCLSLTDHFMGLAHKGLKDRQVRCRDWFTKPTNNCLNLNLVWH